VVQRGSAGIEAGGDEWSPFAQRSRAKHVLLDIWVVDEDALEGRAREPTLRHRGVCDELPKPGRYEIGSVAMANAGADTNGSQFFIVSGPSGVGLPPKYSLFGKVVKGLDVLAEMEAVETDRSDRPRTDIVIQSVTITESD